ncbi:hypothetical protein MATL_G00117860 [Megalops atlanticus]|uniref:Ig-like domain-containing protein n=1 Tax=Megalops atlanticus TaxID=7932 RepID=A0A9D3PX34_MEGAT|nr:hypothetical protein MATL_G00117860 [Megalops atlanticus]
MYRIRFQLYALLVGIAAAGVLRVGGIKIYTPDEVEAVNGTDVRLKCTFQSTHTIVPKMVSVSWNFRPLSKGQEESVFYYHDKPYLPLEGRFRKRVSWAGDIMGGDASIMLREVKFTYNGTFSCQVKNPPDVHGNAGEVRLRVVATASYSEIAILAAAVGGGILLMLIFVCIIAGIRACLKRRKERDLTQPRRERKDPTLCHPARALHLYVKEEEIEIDSSDGMISEPSTKDPSSSSEEEKSSDECDNDDD